LISSIRGGSRNIDIRNALSYGSFNNDWFMLALINDSNLNRPENLRGSPAVAFRAVRTGTPLSAYGRPMQQAPNGLLAPVGDGAWTLIQSVPNCFTEEAVVSFVTYAKGNGTIGSTWQNFELFVETVAAPTFSPAGPEIEGPTQVTIGCATTGASIYYTTDGTTPATSVTGSTFLYTGPFIVNPGTTLSAIAVKAGYKNSTVARVSYLAPLTHIDAVTWTFSNVQVSDGGSVYWTSSNAISTEGTYYASTYTITKVEAQIPLLGWTNVTENFDPADLTGSGEVYGTVPFDVINQPMSGESSGYGASATVHIYVDQNGYLHADITDVNLDVPFVNTIRVSGTVKADAYARVYSAWPVLVVLPGNLEVSAESGTAELAVSNAGGGTMNWSAEVIDGADWLTIRSGWNGTNDGAVLVDYSQNRSPAISRNARIRITASGVAGSPKEVVILQAKADLIPGDADLNGVVDVCDLGILATNYGAISGATWTMGDFTGEGAVDVCDLGILATNYGVGTTGADFVTDAEKIFSQRVSDDADDTQETTSSMCLGLGFPLTAGLLFMGLLLIKLED